MKVTKVDHETKTITVGEAVEQFDDLYESIGITNVWAGEVGQEVKYPDLEVLQQEINELYEKVKKDQERFGKIQFVVPLDEKIEDDPSHLNVYKIIVCIDNKKSLPLQHY